MVGEVQKTYFTLSVMQMQYISSTTFSFLKQIYEYLQHIRLKGEWKL